MLLMLNHGPRTAYQAPCRQLCARYHYLNSHDGELEYVCVLRQAGDKGDGAGDVVRVHHRLDLGAAVCLQRALGAVARELCVRVADVELRAQDAVLAPVKRSAFRQSKNCVLRDGVSGRVWPRRVRGDRAVLGSARRLRLELTLMMRPPCGVWSFMMRTAAAVHWGQLTVGWTELVYSQERHPSSSRRPSGGSCPC